MIAALAVAVALVLTALGPAASAAGADRAVPVVHQSIRATLDVPENRLEASVSVRLARAPEAGEPWRFLLHAGLEPSRISVGEGGQALPFEVSDRWNPRHFWKRPPYAELGDWDVAREIEVPAPAGGWGDGAPTLVLEYAGVIADSLHSPERAYGRSFETTSGRIVTEGAFLSGGTFWLPWSGDDPYSFDLEVTGPADWRTVSQGRLAVDRVEGAHRTMRWTCDHPMEEVYLIAGPYEMREVDHRGVKIQSFCYADTGPEVVDPYLEATGDILDRYDSLFGPYPFSKFALVENYWQTGYGMPSFTFLGNRVIRLPFILYTSYPHEILHNWWGNGVFVDYEKGNWCEGLTTYCADYRAKEAESEKAARDYRRNTLVGYRDYAATGERDFSLVKFRGRDSAATQAVGYGKSLMVFHMLREELGDAMFFGALRRFYGDNLFRRADWDDLLAAFEAETGRELDAWFEQWTRRPGAIRLALEEVETQLMAGDWVTSGVLVQAEPAFEANIPVRVSGGSGASEPAGEGPAAVAKQETIEVVEMRGSRTRFEIRTSYRPTTVAADPTYDVFRLLHAEEVAPTLSGILGAESTRIVLGDAVAGATREALVTLAEDWATDSTIVTVEETAGEALPSFEGGTWYFGDGTAARRFQDSLPAVPESEVPADDSGASFVGAGRGDGRLDRPVGILLPGSADVVPALGRKVPHYSKYSFLRFEGERNVAKGQWDAGDSPMRVQLSAVDAGSDDAGKEKGS